MGLSSIGLLNFNIGMKDTGLAKGISSAQKGFKGLTDTIAGVVKTGVGLASMATRMPRFGPMASQIQGVADDYKLVTTNVEAFGVAADKVTSAQLSGLNMSGKALSKNKSMLAGMAYGLNMDIGTVTEGFVALEQAGVKVSKVGFKNYAEFAKFTNVLGVDSKQLATTLGKLSSKFKMTDAQVKDTLETTTALGKRFNMGAEAVGFMSKSVSVLAEEGAGLWAELGPDKTKRFLQGTQTLAIAFKKAGHSAEEAQELAIGFGQAMIKSRTGVQDLYAGLKSDGDLPEAMLSLTENFGSAEEAFRELQKNPDELAKRFAKAAANIKKNNDPMVAQAKLARFAGQVRDTFGPHAASLVTSNAEATVSAFTEIDKAMSTIDRKNVIGNIAKQYRDGLTATERLGRAQDEFRTRLKKLMGETDGHFLKRFNHSAKVTGDQLFQLAKEGGVVGKTTAMFVEFSNHGLGGVASKISGDYGPAMAALIQQFGPIMSQLPAMATAFKALASPITLVAAALGGAWLYFKEVEQLGGLGGILIGASGGGKYSAFIDGMAKKIPEVLQSAFATLKNVGPKVVKMATEVLTKIFDSIDWGQVSHALSRGMEMAWEGMIGLVKLAGRAGAWLIDAFINIDWSTVASYVAKGAEQIAALTIEGLVYVVKRLPEIGLQIIGGVATLAHALVKGIYKAITTAVDSVGDYLAAEFPAFAGIIRTVFEGLKLVLVPIAVAIGGAFVVSAGKAMVAWVKSFFVIEAGAKRSALQMGTIWAAQTAMMIAKTTAFVAYLMGTALVGIMSFAARAALAFGRMLGPLGLIATAVIGVVGYLFSRKDSMAEALSSVERRSKSMTGGVIGLLSSINAKAKEAATGVEGIKGKFNELNQIKLTGLSEEVSGMVSQYNKLAVALAEAERMKAAADGRTNDGGTSGQVKKLQEQQKANNMVADLTEKYNALRGEIEKNGGLSINQIDSMTARASSLDKIGQSFVDSSGMWGDAIKDMTATYMQERADISKKLNSSMEGSNEEDVLSRRGVAIDDALKASGRAMQDAYKYEQSLALKQFNFQQITGQEMAAALTYRNIKMKQESAKLTEGLTGDARKAAEDQLMTIKAAMSDEFMLLQQRAQTNKLTVAQYLAEENAIEKRFYDEGLHQVKAHIGQVTSSLNVAGSQATTMMGKIFEPFIKNIEESKNKVQSLGDGIQDTIKDIATTPYEAADLLKNLVGKDPETFRKNLVLIKGYFIDMVGSANRQAQGLMDGIKKNFDRFFVDQKRIWTADMPKLLSDFSSKTEEIMGRMWTSLIATSTSKAKELMSILSDTLMSVGSTVNGDVSVTSTAGQTAAPAAGLRPLDNLIAHIDNPTWVGGMRQQMQEEHKQVRELLALIAEVSATGKGKKLNEKISEFTTKRGVQNILPDE